MTTYDSSRWNVVLPVKRPGSSKTRLGGPMREALARAFAEDTARAVLACELARLVVVTDDDGVATFAAELGADVVREPATMPARGIDRLNAALRLGVRQAGLAELPVVALTADLPALRPRELTAALEEAARHRRAFVPDHDGLGTSMLAVLRGAELDPRFGPGSAHEHESSGAVRLALDLPGLRQDVDLPADLRAAALLGCGPATTAVLQTLGEP